MPCVGPNLDQARKNGTDAFLKIREMLEKEYGINPTGFWNSVEEKEEINKRWAAMKESVEELFIQQACEDW